MAIDTRRLARRYHLQLLGAQFASFVALALLILFQM
jgi:hypothetical protein